MVGIQGIGGTSGPVNAKQVASRAKAQAAAAPPKDGIEISGEAQQASLVARFKELSQSDAIRQDRVAQAKQNLEQGVYRVQEVVLQVANRLAEFAR